MSLRERITERGRKALLRPTVMRWVSDDRVMRAAEGMMDARNRVRAAWNVLVNGHELPSIDPALDESLGASVTSEGPGAEQSKRNGAAARKLTRESQPPAERQISAASSDMKESLKNRTSLAAVGGKDVLEKCYLFKTADNARKRGIYPYFRPLDHNDGPTATLEGRRVVMFGSNNYLGLTTHPKVREAAREAINRYGTSMTGSRLVNGSMKLHEQY